MTRRKGELSPSQVDRGWPHQIAIPEDRCIGKNYDLHRAFCKNLSLCERGHTVRHGDVSYRVYCFREPEDAIVFKEAFGGMSFYPEDRGKGARWMIWNRPPGDVRRPSEDRDPYDWS